MGKITQKFKETSLKATMSLGGILCLCIIFIFIAMVCYVRLPVGDDVLYQFPNSASYYIDRIPPKIGDQINSLSDSFVESCNKYILLTGRFIGSFLIGLLSVYGGLFTAVSSALIITGIISVSISIIYGSLHRGLEHPITIIVLFLTLIYFQQHVQYTLMWTMISIYSVSLLLVLLYFNFYKKILNNNLNTGLIYFKINLLGLVTGITHEIFVASLCVYIFIICMIEIIVYKKKIKIFFYHIGLVISSIVCVLAPGNFERMHTAHDSSWFDPYSLKFLNAVRRHIFFVIGIKPYIPFIIIVLLLCILIYNVLVCKRKDVLLPIIKKNPKNIWYFGLIPLMLITSFFLWSLVSYTAAWGFGLFNTFLLIFIFRFIDIFSDNSAYRNKLKAINIVMAIFFVIYIPITNATWISSNFKTKSQWNKLIQYANNNKLEKVEVPKFEEQYSNRFNFFNYANKEFEYEAEYYKKYYGTLLIPK